MIPGDAPNDASIGFVGAARCRLGESPVWDAALQALYWVDSVAPAIHRFVPGSGRLDAWPMPDLVGSIGLGAPGHLVAALRDGFYAIEPEAGRVTPLHRPAMAAQTRFNDGKMDRHGRFLSGTMHMGPTDTPKGTLFRLDAAGRCDVLETGLSTSNGLCFSPAGDRLYFADSRKGVIWAYPYDAASGRVGPRQDLVDTVAAAGSQPDGATVDAEGTLWVALVRTGQIGRFSAEGRLERLIDLPVPHPTCPAFGGAALDVLYVTSISDSGRLVSDHPDAGRLVAITGLGVRGLAETRFGAGRP